MQQSKHLFERFMVIAVVFLLGLWGIYPSFWKFDFKNNIKPGIDISGGTSLVYEIKPPDGGTVSKELVEALITAMKKRVDPNGVKNLVWRSLGENQIEIQMPLTANADDVAKVRKKFSDSAEKLESFNVNLAEVRVAARLSGAERETKMASFAKGSPARQELLKKYIVAQDELMAAEKEGEESALKRIMAKDAIRKIETGPDGLEDTNLRIIRIEADLKIIQDAIDQAKQKKEWGVVKQKEQAIKDRINEILSHIDFEDGRNAFKEYADNFTAFANVRGTVSDAEDLKRMLKGSGVLEFHILVEDSYAVKQMAERLRAEGPSPRPDDTMRWYEIDQEDQFKGRERSVTTYQGKKWALVYITPEESLDRHSGDWGLEKAGRGFDPQKGKPMVDFSFNPKGAMKFGDLTGSHIGKPLAIVLDDRLISAPNINSRIEANGQISGDYSENDLAYMINTLNAGSLPAKLDEQPVREITIASTLGADNLKKGLGACVISVVVVIIIMTFYYHLAGFIASMAVVFNLVMNISVLAMFSGTFTLPGIAALALTLGMAVDANVLIYERLREEQHRGLSLRLALHNAYDRAFSAIFDGNLTTIITSMILYWLGSDEIKGFGLTLTIGVSCSMFTALFVTRWVFDILIEKFNLTHLGSLPLTIPKIDQVLRPKIDWMGKVHWFYIGSAIIIISGLLAFFNKGRDMWDIEFVSGTSVEIELKEPTPINKLRDQLKDVKDLPSPTIVAMGDKDHQGLQYQVITPNPDANMVRNALTYKIGDLLNIQKRAQFDMYDPSPDGAGYGNALNNIIFPVNISKPLPVDYRLPDISYVNGGVAIILKNIDPPLSAADIQDRLNRVRLETKDAAFSIKVFSDNGTTETPTKNLVIFGYGPGLDYETDPKSWKQNLSTKLWSIANTAIGQPPALKRVTTFSPNIAISMAIDASLSLALSIVAISIYLWIRFANFKFGSATVLSLLHDALIAIGVIGLSHYLSFGFFKDFLLIEPQRMNLTMIAAVLTIIGYSVNDTIIVFDRIRENRGKFGFISRQIINNSVNETLSRTLMTTSTTLATIFVMYIFGGESIHGFTYALLSGIIVGTYSSIAIAAPVLLWGGKDVHEDVPENLPATQSK